MKECTTCNGKGFVEWDAYVDGIGWSTEKMPCADCDGSGQEK